MVRRSVFPAAAPGIMTGIILAMARAIGEAAPLILIGGVGFVTFLPNPVSGAYTVLPLQIFDWAKRPQDDFAEPLVRRDHRDPGPDARAQRPRAHRPGPPFETHPVVEENPVNTQLSEAPVRPNRPTDGGGPAIRIAAMPRRDEARRPQVRPSTSSSCRTCRATTASFRAVRNVDIKVAKNAITALIGPSGCGKSTLLRTINRMNDLIPSYRSEGRILLDGQDLSARSVDPVAVRRRVGMVFQKPNPFPKSVYDNVAFGPRINGYKGNMDELVERSLRRAALWDDVKDKLKQSGMALSGGQQQRLCIARTIASIPRSS